MKIEPYFQDQEIPLISTFQLSVKDVTDIVESYRSRTLGEEITLIDDLGGSSGLIEKLKSSLHTGLLSTDSQADRILVFGDNKPPKQTNSTYLQLCWSAFKDPTLRILTCSGFISLIIGVLLEKHPEYSWIEGFSIIMAVFVVINVTALNDYQKQKKFNDLKKLNQDTREVSVFRDKDWLSVHPEVLLVGDIVRLENGITIPADGVLLESSGIEIIESALTGENENIKKLSFSDSLIALQEYQKNNTQVSARDKHSEIPSPVVLSGTNLAEGLGSMLVIAVGRNSAEGRILELTGQEEIETPLMQKLNKLTETIGKIGVVCALITALSLYLRFGLEFAVGSKKSFNSSSDPGLLVKFFIIGITVLVVAIPEGLPLAVTISLAYSVKKMQKENNLVRKLSACETMGGADMICSDKTGTLTQNKMSVSEAWAGLACYSSEKELSPLKTLDAEVLFLIKEAIFSNSSAFIDEKGEKGSKSEIALINFMQSIGHGDYRETRKKYSDRYNKVFPFSSKRKRSSVIICKDNGKRRVHLKGAAEMVVTSCKTFISPEGQVKLIDEDSQTLINQTIKKMTEKALRVIALAYKDLSDFDEVDAIDIQGFPKLENFGFTLISLFGIHDPVRPEVPSAVKKCQKAGITVRMVTGDNRATARAIAKNCNIINSDSSVVMEGKEFAALTGGTVCQICKTKICPCPRTSSKGQKSVRVDVVANFDSFKEIIKNLAVLARSAPDDKYTLVTGLRQLGHVVAVTGDGTNDAPALKKADIGFAMGLSGTEMAKEAAGIILLDDNFDSIVRAVIWGRNVYDNIRCFIQFQVTVNLVAVNTAMIGAITIQQSPLTSVQLLWVNLLMDSFASLALATAPPTESHLDRMPYKRDEFIISRTMWKNLIGQSLVQLIIIFVMLYAGEGFLPEYSESKHVLRNGNCVRSGRNYRFNGEEDYLQYFNDPFYGPSRHMTFIFNVFVLLQLSNEVNCRKIRNEVNVFEGITRNWMFLVILLITYLGQALIIELSGYAFSVSIYGLSWYQWVICLVISFVSFINRLALLLIPSDAFPKVFCK